MTAEAEIVARLKASVPLAGGRVSPNLIPQGATLPAITYTRISTFRAQGLTGSTGLSDPRIQVDSWAADYTSAKNVARQVRLALDNYDNGSIHALIVGERDLFDAESERHRVSQDFSVWVTAE